MTTDTAVDLKAAKALAKERRAKLDAARDVNRRTKAAALELYEAGVSAIQIGEVFGVDRSQVYRWLGIKS